MLFQLKEKFIFSTIFEIFPSIFFYDLLFLGPLPPLKPLVSHGSPIIVLHRKSGKNWISDADRQIRTLDS